MTTMPAEKHEKKVYSLGKTKQLIDINGDSVNFEAVVRVATKNKEPFQFIVLDQSTLDSSPSIEYKIAESGEASTNIKVENNVFQNYYLVLKCDSPCTCEVEILKRELPLVQRPQEVAEPLAAASPSKTSEFNWRNLVLIGGLILAAVGIYLYLKPKNGKDNKDGKHAKQNREIPVLSSPSAKSDSGSSDNNAILQRLKNLNLK